MEKTKLSFWKKLKISIFNLENYQVLAVQTIGKTITYLLKLILVFSLIAAISITAQIAKKTTQMKEYLKENIESLNFAEEQLAVILKEGVEAPAIIENSDYVSTKFLIDTQDIDQNKMEQYSKSMDGYTLGVIILKDKIIFKSNQMTISTEIPFSILTEQYNINHFDKQDIVNFLSGNQLFMALAMSFIVIAFYLFIIESSMVLLDAILYSILGYIEGIIAKIRLRYSAIYNIAVYAMTLPIILNLIYFVVNTLTGFTIQYFQIMYIAITCIYIITAILIMKSDIIKQQIELSKIIEEQEKIKQEMLRKEQEEKEAQEQERLRKEDEKKKKGKKKKDQEPKGENDETPQPEANINPAKS